MPCTDLIMTALKRQAFPLLSEYGPSLGHLPPDPDSRYARDVACRAVRQGFASDWAATTIDV